MALGAPRAWQARYNSTINDPGYFVFGDRRFRDSKPGGHGVVDLHKSIVVSSDTYYYMLANDMGIDAIAGFMKRLGLGSPTGIDLQGEATGVLPSPEWKMKRFRRPEQQRWYPGETISIGIGQGTTPIRRSSWRTRWRRWRRTARCTARASSDTSRTPHARATELRAGAQGEVPLKREWVEFVKRAMAGSIEKVPAHAHSPKPSTRAAARPARHRSSR